MKIFKLLVTLLVLTVMLVSCGFGGQDEHVCEFGEWEITKEPTCTESGESVRYCKDLFCFEYETDAIEPLGHQEVEVAAVPATCYSEGLTAGKACKVCKATLEKQNTVGKISHTEEEIPATEQKTAGVRCSVCREVLVAPQWIFASDYESPSSYDGDYGYEYLATLPNGEAMRSFYLAIDGASDIFHLGEGALNENNVYAVLDFTEYDISKEEALTVWSFYRADRPLYYWISNSVLHTSKEIHLVCNEDYIKESDRAGYNSEIYNFVADIAESANDTASIYELALAFHDAIILSADYAYEPDGVTPADSSSAHNILGIISEGFGVCESYAKTFQLLLNFSDVENAFVTGESEGQNHAWNIAKMDDGAWYWFDLTWDDTPDWRGGVSYNYFCVNDTQNVKYREGYITTEGSFLDDHTVGNNKSYGIDYTYDVPSRAVSVFSSAEIPVIGNLITVNESVYKIAGYRTLALVKAALIPEYTVSERVSYGGADYTVLFISSHGEEDVFPQGIKSISIPKSIMTLKEITLYPFESVILSPENPYFTEDEYGIYDKNKTILYFLKDKSLESFHIVATLQEIYAPSYLFADADNLKEFTVDSANASFAVYDGILYNLDFTELVWIPKAIEGSVTVKAGVKRIGLNESRGAIFANCHNLTSVYLPSTVEAIGAYAFAYINSVTIYFDGSEAEFMQVIASELWDTGADITVVYN